MTKRFTRWLRRIRLSHAERELAFIEARIPLAVADAKRHRDLLAARVRADQLVSSAEAIAKKLERQAKRAGVLA